MVITGAAAALIWKMLPYMLIMKGISGILDVGVHYVKMRISKGR